MPLVESLLHQYLQRLARVPAGVLEGGDELILGVVGEVDLKALQTLLSLLLRSAHVGRSVLILSVRI